MEMKDLSQEGIGPQESLREAWMRMALEEAALAGREGEVPIGAVAVLNHEVVTRNHNRCIQDNDPSAHAEILVLRSAGRLLANYRLKDLILVVTLEPCAMCCGALIWGRVGKLIFGARDEKAGAVVSKTSLLSPGLFNHDVDFEEGILANSCQQILRDFFSERRKPRR